jgi:endonuclease/exonuclease/phosphatase family metal-dependent hydrolase
MRRDPWSVCWDNEGQNPPGQQCERLFPTSIYEVRWTELSHGKYECTAIKKSKASVIQSYDISSTFACDGADTGALRVDVSWANGGEAEILNAHLFGPRDQNDTCRAQQIHNMYENAAGSGPSDSIVAGDMNMDPYRSAAWGCGWSQSAEEWTREMQQYAYDYHSNDELTGLACSTGAPD